MDSLNEPTRGSKLRVIPLGGLGEIGKNMMAVEYLDDIVVIDVGFAFPTASHPGIDYRIPVTTYLEQNKHKLRGYVITHAHEDHIGALPFVLSKLPAPLYGARFTLGMIEKKLHEYQLETAPVYRPIDPDRHERIKLGQHFEIELVRVTHSIPDACAVVIRTPAGLLVHTGDWRLDTNPVDGKKMDLDRLGEIATEGVKLLMSDSTDCEVLGRTTSESTIAPELTALIGAQSERVIVSAIGSNVHRMQSIIDAAAGNGRTVAVVGRSMVGNVELAVRLGYLRVSSGTVKPLAQVVNLPGRQQLILATGHQGETNSALNRMARGDHPQIKIKTDDVVIFSSSIIPGNELSVSATVDLLMREGAKVYQNPMRHLDGIDRIHAGGHAPREDLAYLISLLQPESFMPIHGEYHHLLHHRQLAIDECGLNEANAFILGNGDVLELDAFGPTRRNGCVESGEVIIDGSAIGDVDESVLKERLELGREGIIMVAFNLGRNTGRIVGDVGIMSRGFIQVKENVAFLRQLRVCVREAVDNQRRLNTKTSSGIEKNYALEDALNTHLQELIFDETGRYPLVLQAINEV